MFFLLSKVFWFFLSPVFLLWAVLWAGLFLAWRRRPWGLRLLAGGIAALTALEVIGATQCLLKPIEDRFPPLTVLPSHIDGIIVLGGGLDPELSDAHGRTALTAAGERMTEGVRLALLHPEAKLVFTGGSASLVAPDLHEGPWARRLWESLGVAPGRIIIEEESRNTTENIRFSAVLLKPRPGEVWVAVTSAWHMPRTIGCFHRQGWQVIADPVGYKTSGRLEFDMTSFEDVSAALKALHEWTGLIVYGLTGKTDSIFPHPS